MQTYGLFHLWQQGDWMTRGIALLLLAMSIASWTVIVLKGIELRHIARHAAHADAHFWDAQHVEAGMQTLGRPGSLFYDLADAGQAAVAHHEANRPRLHERIELSDWLARTMRSSVEDAAARLQRGLALLASIGATAPFVGLLGTVWGIYHALVAIGASGEASLDHVAGPVGEALVMTALGLMVAIPAVLGYNALTRISRGIVAKLNRFAHGLHALLLTGARPWPRKGAAKLVAGGRA